MDRKTLEELADEGDAALQAIEKVMKEAIITNLVIFVAVLILFVQGWQQGKEIENLKQRLGEANERSILIEQPSKEGDG